MSGKRTKLMDQLRGAIEASGIGHNRLARATGLQVATISRFVNGKGGLSVEGLDAIGEVLGLTLVWDAEKVERTKRRDAVERGKARKGD